MTMRCPRLRGGQLAVAAAAGAASTSFAIDLDDARRPLSTSISSLRGAAPDAVADEESGSSSSGDAPQSRQTRHDHASAASYFIGSDGSVTPQDESAAPREKSVTELNNGQNFCNKRLEVRNRCGNALCATLRDPNSCHWSLLYKDCCEWQPRPMCDVKKSRVLDPVCAGKRGNGAWGCSSIIDPATCPTTGNTLYNGCCEWDNYDSPTTSSSSTTSSSAASSSTTTTPTTTPIASPSPGGKNNRTLLMSESTNNLTVEEQEDIGESLDSLCC
mmetsp:Transcript_21745/g.54834  ORF Transcript_21745/g.54834 Transcript_21745/m.54834 type:complete len:273 (-) Transcript_21745:297-1115(-)